MKTKLILFLAFFCFGTAVSFAQISTGKPSSREIRTGNRPEAGDFGLYLGMTSDIVKGFDKNTQLKALPLLNFKYMMTDQLEGRLGLELLQSSTKYTGDLLSNNTSGEQITIPTSDVTGSSTALLYPGIAWHFSSKNILDVYVGAELPFGWQDNYTSRTASGTPEMGESGTETIINRSTDITKRSFVIGIGAFFGVQAFIANLPLAIGAEFGLSSRFDTGVKYKYVTRNGAEEQRYYTTKLNDAAHYDNLVAKTGEIGGQVRLTLTYYFK